MEGCVPAAVMLIGVSAGIEHRGDDIRVALQRGPSQRRAAIEGFFSGGRSVRGEPAAHGRLVAGEDLRDGRFRTDHAMRKSLERRVERHDR